MKLRFQFQTFNRIIIFVFSFYRPNSTTEESIELVFLLNQQTTLDCASDKINDVKIFTFDITEQRTENGVRCSAHRSRTIISNEHDNKKCLRISN